MSMHVFAGPSVDAATVHSLLPEAVVHPPIAHGDLARVDIGPSDTVVILDGVFFQTAPVRHKEICELLAAGVTVHGAASMGALRAAELAPFGMLGSGVVYRLYSGGILDADDEVALVHTAPEVGARPLTVALVSVRVALRRLVHRRVLGRAGEDQLVNAARAIPFTERTWPAVLARAAAGDGPLPGPVAAAVRAHVTQPPASWDVKTQDALRLLHRFAAGPVRPVPAGGPSICGPSIGGPSIGGPSVSAARSVPRTTHVDQWSRVARPESTRRLTAAQLFAADYPALHREAVLRLLTAAPTAAGGGLDQLAVDIARSRGLLPPAHRPLPARLSHWLTADAGHTAGGAGDSGTALLATILARSYRWHPATAPWDQLTTAVTDADTEGWLDKLLAEVEEFNAALVERGRDLGRVAPAAVDHQCRRWWSTPSLAPALYDRGFTNRDDLTARAAWFCPYMAVRAPWQRALGDPVPQQTALTAGSVP